ncbi:MAG: polymer-forming cytoskeletal protein [Nitrospirales bacterium]
MAQEKDEFSNRTMERTLSELGDIVAFVGHEVQFSGVLTYKGNVRIDGTFEGEIETEDTLFIGEQANVKAQIHAGAVIASGRVTGEITAVQRVELKSPATIDASITTPKLSMDNGVIFNGKITMGSSIGQGKAGQVKSKKTFAPVAESKDLSRATAETSDTLTSEVSGSKNQEDNQTESAPS